MSEKALHLLPRSDGTTLSMSKHAHLLGAAQFFLAAHRGGHLRLEMLALLLGAVLDRPHAEVLLRLLPPRTHRPTEAERQKTKEQQDARVCWDVLTKLVLKVERQVGLEQQREEKLARKQQEMQLRQQRLLEERAKRQSENEVRGVLSRVLRDVERALERDEKQVAREVSALTSIMVRQVEAHVDQGHELGSMIGIGLAMPTWARLAANPWDEARKVVYRRRDATDEDISASSIVAVRDYLVSLGGSPDLVAGWWATRETRREGSSAGTTDIYFFSPHVKRKFRSRMEIARYFGFDIKKAPKGVQPGMAVQPVGGPSAAASQQQTGARPTLQVVIPAQESEEERCERLRECHRQEQAREVLAVLNGLIAQLEGEAGYQQQCAYCDRSKWTSCQQFGQHRRSCFERLCAELAPANDELPLTSVRLKMQGWPLSFENQLLQSYQTAAGRSASRGRGGGRGRGGRGRGGSRDEVVNEADGGVNARAVRAAVQVARAPDRSGVCVVLKLSVMRQRRQVSRLRDDEVFGPGTPNPRLPKPPKPQLFVAIRGGELVPVASALDLPFPASASPPVADY